MSEVMDLAALEWKETRPDIATAVVGKAMVDGTVKVVLTKVAPGGRFGEHRDAYAHFFYFLSGSGRVWLDGNPTDAFPGTAVRVDAGALHSYENTGSEDLVLISMNIP